MAGRQKGSTTLTYIKDPILEPYFIQMDDHNYTLCKNVPTQNGDSYETKLGFFGDLDRCINRIVRDQITQKNYDSLQDYLTEYKELQNRLINHFNI